MLRIMCCVSILLAVGVLGCSPPSPSADDKPPVKSKTRTKTGSTEDGRPVAATTEAAAAPIDGAARDIGKDVPSESDVGSSPSVPADSPPDEQPPPALPDVPQLKEEVANWLEQMGSDAATERRAAGDALDEQGQAAIPSVVFGLRHGTLAQRRGAATYLIGRVSPRDDEAVLALIEALSATDEVLRHAALQSVERLSGQQLMQALPSLMTVATNQAESAAYRSRAVHAVAKLESGAESVLPQLIDLARTSDSLPLRRASFFAISKVAPAEKAEEFFRGQLNNDVPADLRRLAVKWLGAVARSDQALQSLVQAFGDMDQDVRLEAVDALVAIGKPTLPILITSFDAAEVELRRHAVVAVGKMGLLAADAAPALKALQNDPDQQVRELAAAALKLVVSQ